MYNTPQQLEQERTGRVTKIKWLPPVPEGAIPTECPHCGHDEFYQVVYFSGSSEYGYRFDGNEAYNTELHDGCNYRENKTVYCRACRTKLGIQKNE